jgi:hypothetical protein
MNEWNWMEWVPSYSIPFHSFFTKPNNGISLYPTSFHSIPSLSTNPNIAQWIKPPTSFVKLTLMASTSMVNQLGAYSIEII